MPLNYELEEQKQSAERIPRYVTIRLRPSDLSLIKKYSVGDKLNIEMSGKMTALAMSESGGDITLDIDLLGIEPPEPTSLDQEMKVLKILRS